MCFVLFIPFHLHLQAHLHAHAHALCLWLSSCMSVPPSSLFFTLISQAPAIRRLLHQADILARFAQMDSN